MSPVVDLHGLVSRRLLRQAMEDVRRNGGRAPGPDGLAHETVFGHGPGSSQYRETEHRLGRQKHGYSFGPAREVLVYDEATRKQRLVSIVSFHDRTVLRAVALAIRGCLSSSPVAVCRSGLDGRWSVARAAVHLRVQPNTVALRSDLQAAFPSLCWRAVLGSDLARTLPEPARLSLTAIYGFYSPGIGVPMGLPTSTLMLDLACIRFDEQLSYLGALAFRYVDDVLILGSERDIGDRFLEVVERELRPFGLAHHEAKTSLHDDTHFRGRVLEGPIAVRPFPVAWLGHELSSRGAISVAKSAQERVALRTSQERGYSAPARPIFGAQEARDEVFRQQRQEAAENNTQTKGGTGTATGWTGSACRGATKPHPSNAPDGGRPMRPHEATEAHAGGRGRGRRGAVQPRLPRPDRKERLRERSAGFGGQLGLLRAAAEWSAHSQDVVAAGVEAQVLFGEPVKKVHQFGRAFRFWQLAKTVLESTARSLRPNEEEAVVRQTWSVLMSAATLTEVEAVRFCVTDPLEQILLRVGRKSAVDCRRQIARELRARNAGRRPIHVSLWGRLTTHLRGELGRGRQ